MSQGHYLGSVKDNQDLDPQFKSLLKHHWVEEEVQHQALRWTFLGSALGNRNFLAALATLSDEAAARVEQAAKSFGPH